MFPIPFEKILSIEINLFFNLFYEFHKRKLSFLENIPVSYNRGSRRSSDKNYTRIDPAVLGFLEYHFVCDAILLSIYFSKRFQAVRLIQRNSNCWIFLMS